MADSITVSALQRVKLADGSYAIVLPINTSDEVFVDINNNKNLTSELNEIHVTITHNRDTVIDDFIEILSQLSPFIPKPLNLNHIFTRDMTTNDWFTLISGIYTPGTIFI